MIFCNVQFKFYASKLKLEIGLIIYDKTYIPNVHIWAVLYNGVEICNLKIYNLKY